MAMNHEEVSPIRYEAGVAVHHLKLKVEQAAGSVAWSRVVWSLGLPHRTAHGNARDHDG